MKTIKLLISILLISSLAACVSLPKTPAFDLPLGAKVGYDISVAETIAHTHYGTTVFNNFRRVKEGAEWGLNDYAKSETERLIRLHGFEPVEIKLEELVVDEEKLSENADQAELDARHNARLTKLAEMDVQAMIVLKAHENIVAYECSNYGCTEFSAEHAGFYSRGMLFFPAILHAVLPSSNTAYVVEPFSPVYKLEGPYSQFDPQLNLMKGFKPADFKNMSDEEWLAVKEKLEELITLIIDNNVKSLRAGSDGQGGFIRDVP